MTVVERTELRTTDMDLLASLLREQYVDHVARFRCADPAAVEGQVRTATADGLTAGRVGYDGFRYTANVEAVRAPTTVAVLRGAVTVTARAQEHCFTAGDVMMLPTHQPTVGETMTGVTYVTLQVPWTQVHTLAEEGAGVPAGSLRFESTAPVSAALGRAYPAPRRSSTTSSSPPRPLSCPRSSRTR
jgi:hypothetical protein